jgi:hypothetical protein
MQSSLMQTFNETAAAAYEAFPRELERLVVLLVPSSDTPVYVSPKIADQLTGSTEAIKAAVEERTCYLENNSAAGVANRKYKPGETFVSMITLNGEDLIGNYTQKFTEEMYVIFNLDHEIGHLILRNGSRALDASPQCAESACDAYAMLRHIQRFGKDTDHAGYRGEQNAAVLIYTADPEHYTTDAIEKAILISEERDISALSLQETAALAEEIANDCRLDGRTLDKIRKAFRPVQKLYVSDKHYIDLCCKNVLSVMKKHRHDPDIFRAGRQFFNRPEEKEFITESAKTDPYWQEALAFIENREAKVPRHSPAKFMTKIFTVK